jgi:hypothetical protein
MYSVEQFIELSPPEAHTEEALSEEHQLMLNRLGFELVERQRFDTYFHWLPRRLIMIFRFAAAQTRSKGQRAYTGKGRSLEIFKGSSDHHGGCKGADRDSSKGTRLFVSASLVLSIIFRPDCVRNRQKG